MLIDFPHSAPEGYTYEYEQFNTRVVAIWLRHSHSYSYSDGRSVRSIWGFYSPKKQVYFAPINAKTVGKEVKFSNTTPYTAMQLKQTPLESAFV